jgi:ABC-type bacteriocin/lantibiotic exporter with double-glycine peptidase domain
LYLKNIRFLVEQAQVKLVPVFALSLILAVLELIVSGAIATAMVGNYNFIDKFFKTNLDGPSLVYLALILVSIVCIKTVIQILNYYFITGLALTANVQWSIILLKKYLNLTDRNIASVDTEEEIYEIHSLTSSAAQQGLLNVIKLLSDGLLFVCITVFLLNQFPKEVIFSLLFLFIVAIIFAKIIFPKAETLGKAANDLSQSNLGLAKDSLRNRRQVKFMRSEANIIRSFENNGFELIKNARYSSVLLGLPKVVLDFLAINLIVISIVLAELSSFDLMALGAALGIILLRLLPLGASIITSLNAISHSKNSVNRLYESIKDIQNETKSQTKEKNSKIQKIKVHNLIKIFKNKKISYPNMIFEKGKISTIKGPSGSGKTLLAEMILGLSSSEKSIEFIRENGSTFYPTCFMENSFFIDQKGASFNDDLFETIFLQHNVASSKIKKAKDIISTHSIFKFLQNEHINKINVNAFSGGEYQRLSLLRALLLEKEILICDEPSSALDENNKNHLYSILSNIKKNKIIIVISHDDQINKYSDKNYTLKV